MSKIDRIVMGSKLSAGTVCIDCSPSEVLYDLEYTSVDSKSLVVIFPQWNSRGSLARRRARRLNRRGKDTLIVHVRPCVIRPDVQGTLDGFYAVRDQAVARLQRLTKRYDRLECEAVSLGVMFGLLVGRSIQFDAFHLVVGGSELADIAWQTPKEMDYPASVLKELQEQGHSLSALRESWKDISAIYNVAATVGAETSVIVANRDHVVSVDLQLALVDELLAVNPETKVHAINGGHVLTALRHYYT